VSTSEGIGDLAAALAKAQGAMTNAEKDRENPFFHAKYATLASIWNACRGALSSNGLAVTQITSRSENGLTLVTLLMHASGQWISSEYPVNPIKNDPQGMGSALTYARRYGLSAIIGQQADEDDEDDDGNAASEKTQPTRQAQAPMPARTPVPTNGHAAAEQPKTQTPAGDGFHDLPASPASIAGKADEIRQLLRSSAEFSEPDATHVLTPDGERKVRANFRSALAILEHDSANRHAITKFLFGSDDPAAWSVGQCTVGFEWISPAQVGGELVNGKRVGGEWIPSADSVEGIKAILAAVPLA
jgi:hypothetical protein